MSTEPKTSQKFAAFVLAEQMPEGELSLQDMWSYERWKEFRRNRNDIPQSEIRDAQLVGISTDENGETMPVFLCNSKHTREAVVDKLMRIMPTSCTDRLGYFLSQRGINY